MTSIDHSQSDKPQMGGRVRRLRRQQGLSQARLATELGISASYLNLIEHNRRNVTVPLLIKLAERFELELSDIADGDEGRLNADLMEAFGDELFGDLDLTNADVRDLVTSNGPVARAILALYDRYRNMRDDAEVVGDQPRHDATETPVSDRLPSEQVSDFLQARANHFPELEEAAAVSGARPLVAFLTVTVPASRESIVAGLALAWARALGEFGATVTFAGNLAGRTRTLPLQTFIALESDPEAALAISVLLLTISLGVLVALRGRWLVR
mgnify:CR=1 FL=1